LTARNLRKWLSSLLVLLLVVTLWAPSLGASAATKQETKASKGLSQASILQMKRKIFEQQAALEKGPVLHPDLQKLTGEEEISLIVQLDKPPVAMVKGMNKVNGKPFTVTMEKAAKDTVTTQQANFEKKLAAQGIKAKYGFKYNYAFNGMSIKIKANQVKKLAQLDEVALVEPDAEVHALGQPSGLTAQASVAKQEDTFKPAMNTSNPFLDIPSLWSLGYEGQNVKVAVLDTGIDYHHPEFEGVYKGGHNFISQTTAAGYSRPRAADDPYETSPLDRASSAPEFDGDGTPFYTDHGTHVAGTIAAQGKNLYGIKGIAPKIELYAYRVLGAYGTGSTSGIIAAIDKAVTEKMDIINLSLGGSQNSQTTSDAIAINNAVLAGTTAVIANGNDGPSRGTIGSPATSALGISVGNSTNPETMLQGTANVTVQGTAPTSYPMNLMGWKFGTNPGQLLTGTYDLVSIPNFGVDADYTGKNVSGKVALVSRGGNIPFVDKIAAAKKAGAVAVIIHNNSQNGSGPSGIFLGDAFPYIPTFDMSYTAGSALRTALATKTATVTFTNFITNKTAGDEINDSSSRGPSNPEFDIKPDVSAPGTNIMSSIPAYKKDYPNASYAESYDRFTGTSMATPHIAGIAALLKSMHPDWTPVDIKVALTTTAKQLDTTKYDVFAQGGGRVQPVKAATAEALAYSLDTTTFDNKSYDNIKGTITFGNVTPSPTAAVTLTKDILVKNLSGKPSDYTVTVQTTKAATGTIAGAAVTVDQSNFTLSTEKTLKVTLTVPKGTGSVGDELLGYVKLTNGTTNLSLPFAANFSPPTGLKSFTADSMHISPNGDGKLDSTTVRYEFYDQQYFTFLELWDAMNPEGGTFGDGYLGYLVSSESTTVGPKTVNFDGKITSWATYDKVSALDGVYSLDLSTTDEFAEAYVGFDWIGPVYVKSTKPTIVAQNATANAANFVYTGSVQDSYVNWKQVVEEVFEEPYNVNDNLHARYELTNSAGEQVGGAPITLNDDGSFAIDLTGLTNGDNKLKLIFDDEAQNHAEKVVTISATIPVVNPDPDPTPDPTLEPGQGLLVKGKEPMAGLAFSLYSTGSEQVWYDYVTDGDGVFTHNLPDGEYHIVGIWQDPTWYEVNKTFTVSGGLVDGKPLVVDALDYQLPPSAQWNVKGVIVDGANGLAKIPFSLRTKDGSEWYSATTDSAGRFIYNLPDNTYVVEGIWVEATKKWHVLNHEFVVKNGALEGASELVLDVTPPVANYNMTGTLTQGNVALSNLVFSLRTAGTGDSTWYDVVTNANGEFGAALPAGSYIIEGIWNDAEGKWYELKKEFTVVAGTPLVLNIDIPSSPPVVGASISGILTKADVPISGLTFSVEDNSGNWYSATTGSDGSFSFKLPDGRYKVHGIWNDSESKWYVLNRIFYVTNGKLESGEKLLIKLP
jgi:minor extracellular serine protease Vpr